MCAQNRPNPVSTNWKVKQSNGLVVANQTYLAVRRSTLGPNSSDSSLRIREFTPSAAITRSYCARSSASGGASVE